jgi:nucleotide-binding universal stress UspA family protein
VIQLQLAGLKTSCVLVNVQESATLYEVVVAHDRDAIADVKRDAGSDLLAPAEALLQGAGIDFESEVAAGTPATLLIELIENYRCDAVVIGTHDLGPVTMALLEHSPVPVTVLRLPETEDGEG